MNKCYNCGSIDLREYEGLLGYEALSCYKCNCIRDWQGVWLEDKLIKTNYEISVECLNDFKYPISVQ